MKHTVFVPTGVYPLTGGPLTIWSNVTIQSVGGQVTLDAQRTGRVVKINKEGKATFKGFLITNGKVTDGGAGVLNEGILSLVDTVVNASASIDRMWWRPEQPRVRRTSREAPSPRTPPPTVRGSATAPPRR